MKEITEKSETARLRRLYKDLPKNRKAVAEGLIAQAARLRVALPFSRDHQTAVCMVMS